VSGAFRSADQVVAQAENDATRVRGSSTIQGRSLYADTETMAVTDEAPRPVRRISAPAWLRTARGQIGFIVAAGLLAFLPALRSPFWLDDYVQRAMLEGSFPSHRNPFDLYNFVSDADRTLLIQKGVVPWWADPHLTIRFFRPLSSLLRWLDHRLLRDLPLLDHAHSFVWWVIAVIGARELYRRFLSPRATFVATFIFALAPCHAVPLAWLANREVLVSLAFGTFGLGAYARWRDGLRARDGLAAAALFALAMLGGEYGLVFGAYVFAMEAYGFTSWREASQRVLPFAIPAAVTLAARRALGFGNSGSGFYRDPIHQTRIFVEGVPRRMARLLVDSWLTSESDWVNDTQALLLGAFILIVGVLILLTIRRALAAQRDEARRAGGAWLLGSLLAMLPMTAVLPSSRLLGISAVGVAPVVALVIDHEWFEPRVTHAGVFNVVALLLGFFHLVHGPVTSFLASRFFYDTSHDFAERAAGLRRRIGDPADAEVVMARAGWQTVLFSPFALERDGTLPRRWWVLSLAPHALILRTGARTIDLLVPRGKGYFPTGPDDLFRSEDNALPAGYEVRVPGMHVKILDVGEHGPVRIRFDFDKKLESLVWVADGKDAFLDATPPRIGFGLPLDP
jgi:hypothetical protein